MNQPINNNQLSCIHALISKLRLKERKEEMVLGFTSGRSGSSKDLTSEEANAMIRHLKQLDPEEVKAEKMRRKIISMAHEMGWKVAGNTRADMQRIDAWCVKFGYKHKKLNQYLPNEMPALVTQFEAVYKSFLKGI